MPVRWLKAQIGTTIMSLALAAPARLRLHSTYAIRLPDGSVQYSFTRLNGFVPI
jgi:hypothetical protein